MNWLLNLLGRKCAKCFFRNDALEQCKLSRMHVKDHFYCHDFRREKANRIMICRLTARLAVIGLLLSIVLFSYLKA